MAILDSIRQHRAEVVARFVEELTGLTGEAVDIWVYDLDGPLMAAEEVCGVTLAEGADEAAVFQLLDELVAEAKRRR